MIWNHNPGFTAMLKHLEDLGCRPDIGGACEEGDKREAIAAEMLHKVAENGSATRDLMLSLLRWINDAYTAFSCEGADNDELQSTATKLYGIVTGWSDPTDLGEIDDALADCFGRVQRREKARLS